MWELHRLELRSRRFRLQQATTQEQEPNAIHPRNSRSRRISLPPQQDRSACSHIKTNTTAATEPTASEGELDDPKERREGSTRRSRSTNYNMKKRTCRPLDDPPPPEHPPHRKTPTSSSRSMTTKIIANKEEINDSEDRREDPTKR